MNQPGFTYHALVGKSHTGMNPGTCEDFSRRRLLGTAFGVNWRCMLVQLRTNASFIRAHPRLVFEVHGGYHNATHMAADLRNVGETSEHMRAMGCVTTSFGFFRDPTKFLASNLHDSFRHSWFKPRYAVLANRYPPNAQAASAMSSLQPADYRNPTLHAVLSDWLPQLVDSQLKQVHAYAGGAMMDLLSPDASVSKAHVAHVQRLVDAWDVVGITERGTESILLLMERAGLSNYQYHIAGANEAVKAYVRNKQPDWPAVEKPLIARIIANSSHDQWLHRYVSLKLDRLIREAGPQFRCRLGIARRFKPLLNPRVYPCIQGKLINDRTAPWARCIPVELCGHTLYAPSCSLDQLLPGQPGWLKAQRRERATITTASTRPPQ
jgi:hypothetical protein